MLALRRYTCFAMHALHPCFLQDLRVWNLVLPLDFNSFLKQFKWKWVSLFAWRWYTVQVLHAYKRAGSTTAFFQLGVKLDSISFVRSLPNATLAVMHCSGESASQVDEFINFQFLSIHSDGWFIVRFSRCWLVYNLCLFCADCEIIVIT